MSLLSVAECRALVKSGLSDADLQIVIDRVESDLTGRIGAFQDDTGNVEVTETGYLSSSGQIFTRQMISSVVSLEAGGNSVTASEYTLHTQSGWISDLQVYYSGGSLPVSYTIVYKPVEIQGKLKAAIIDLVRLVAGRTEMKSENIAGEYSYQAPDWESESRKIVKRVTLPNW